MTTRREILRGMLSMGAATAAWTAGASSVIGPVTTPLFEGGPLPRWVGQLVEGGLVPWETGDLSRLTLAGQSNPEWDFMGRTFLGLAAANLALREPDRADRYVAAMDRLIDHTLQMERKHGFTHYLMAYGRRGGWLREPAASVFVDGEIAALLAARVLIGGGTDRIDALGARLVKIRAAMRAGPRLSAESYPNECWTFCNTFALAAFKLAEASGVSVDPTLPEEWLGQTRAHLLDAETGMLPSSFRLSGAVLDGPEGSSLWMSAHNLLLVDPTFAADQYRRGREALLRSALGFGWAREWPPGTPARMDVDSGPIVPVLNASPGSSGLALVAAKAFDDQPAYDALTASLELAAFPEVDQGRRRYLASNAVGDAVLLYSAVQGPLWDLARRRLS